MAYFITFEGGDGAGKSTLINGVLSEFKKRGISHVNTREPGGTPVAEEIREIIIKPGRKIEPMTELFLFEASRAEHVANFIKPNLAKNTHVICDRYTHSSLAYQGVARGLGFELVDKLNEAATGGLKPDAVVWLKITPEQAAARVESRGNQSRLDAESLAFHKKVYEAFSEISAREASRFIVLDAVKSPAEVFNQLITHPLWMKLFP